MQTRSWWVLVCSRVKAPTQLSVQLRLGATQWPLPKELPRQDEVDMELENL